MVEQHAKFVAAKPCDRVVGAGPHQQLLGDVDQREVAAAMAEAVVEDLEVVEIDEQHRRRNRVTLMPGDHRFQVAQHPTAIGERDERVAVGERLQLKHLVRQDLDIAAQPHDFFQQCGRIGTFMRHIVHLDSPMNRAPIVDFRA